MRIRSIKPGFWTSETIARVRRRARLTFVGLWSYVDDNGVGVDNDRLITAALYPLEDNPLEALDATGEDLAELAAAGVIVRYEVAGKRLLFVTNWDEHQKPSHPSKPRYPRPDRSTVADEPTRDDAESGAGQRPAAPVSGQAPETHPSGSALRREKGEGNREKGEGKKTSSSSSGPAAPPRDHAPRADAEHADPPPADGDSSRPDAEALCARLHERITAGGSKATVTAGWRRAARLLLERDGRELGEALRLVDWCQADAFWSANVLSLPTFRRQYDRLRLRAAQDPGWRWSRPVEEIPDVEIDPDAILGADVASPPAPPREIDTGPAEARREWFEAWREQRHTERIEQARRVLAQRAEQQRAAG